MGLDIHFYKKEKPLTVNNDKDNFSTINNLISCINSNSKLQDSLLKLNNLAKSLNRSMEDCLVEAIQNFIGNSDDYYDNEIAYFRGFWWLINKFNYNDSWYDKDMTIALQDLQELYSLSESAIKAVIEHFNKKKYKVIISPLSENADRTTLRNGRRDYCNLLVFKYRNHEIDLYKQEKLISEANDVCKQFFHDSNDLYLFFKVCELYWQTDYMIKNTDWEFEYIVMNADW